MQTQSRTQLQRLIVVDFVAFVALAVSIALSVGLVMSGAVLLLAA